MTPANLVPTIHSGGGLGQSTSAALVAFDAAVLRADFDRRPFLVRHQLADHPLFTLPRLMELARGLPAKQVEYNAGDVPVNLDPTLTPRNGLSIEETIRRIQDCKSWMVLRYVEHDPEYRDLLHRCLAEVERLTPEHTRGLCQREAFIFISSPGSVTPYHLDSEHNFLLQIRGQKSISIWDPSDRSVLSEEEIEMHYAGGHRNKTFKEEYQQKAQVFELTPGLGVHFPVTAPHWVKNGADVSVSFSITFQTRATERRASVYYMNRWLRGRGWRPKPFGVSPLRDSAKFNAYRLLRRTRRLLGLKPLEASEY